MQTALLSDKRWGNKEQPAPLGLTDLGQAVGLKTKGSFEWLWNGSVFQSNGTPLAMTRWTYIAAVPTSTVQASS